MRAKASGSSSRSLRTKNLSKKAIVFPLNEHVHLRLAGVHANLHPNDFLITRALREKCGKCRRSRILRKALSDFAALLPEA